MKATRWLWQQLGRPAIAAGSVASLLADIEAQCSICGVVEFPTAKADKALGANFSDRGHLTHEGSDRICQACLWCCSGKPPATLRMWSIAAGGPASPSHPKAWLQETPVVCLTNRANPRPIRDLLMNPPDGEWLVTVAYSGQKHVIPYATTNHGPGTWTVRVEDHYVTSNPATFRHVHQHAEALRRLGVPEDAVMSGTPAYIKTANDLAAWKEHADQLTAHLGSPLLRLALWTITKETMK